MNKKDLSSLNQLVKYDEKRKEEATIKQMKDKIKTLKRIVDENDN